MAAGHGTFTERPGDPAAAGPALQKPGFRNEPYEQGADFRGSIDFENQSGWLTA